MRNFRTRFISKKLITAAAVALTLGIVFAGSVMLANPSTSHAAPVCPQDKHPETNVFYCGIDGSSVNNAISSLQNYYNKNSDASGSSSQPSNMIHTDIKAVLNDPNWGHASASMIAGMNASNTKLGISKSDGTIVVDGKVVGTDMWIAARWNSTCTTPFKHVEGDVYVHSYKCFFNDTFSEVPTLVHFDANGKADFAAWAACDNVLTFTATTPPVTPKLTCDRLDATQTTSSSTVLGYDFVAHATGTNAPIQKYVFDFGDNTTQTVNTSRGFTNVVLHNYALKDVAQNLPAKVTVFAVGFPNGVTSQSCMHTVNVPALPPAPVPTSQLECKLITANLQPGTNNTYTFTATGTPTNTTIDSFTFDFFNSDNTQDIPSQTVTTTASSATTPTAVAFPSGSTHRIQASVKGPLGSFTSSNCVISKTIPQVLAAQTTALVNAGPGSVIGLFSVVSLAGGLFHWFVLRRKLIA